MKFYVNLRMEKLKIGFDAKRAVRNFTGLGNYSRLVVDVLSREYPANDYRLYAPSVRQNDRLKPLVGRNNITLVTPDTAAGRAFPALWRVYGGLTSQIARDGIGLFHGLSNELPLDIARAGIPTVVTIHDLIFRRLPACYKPVDRAIYDYKFRHACENATRVIAISERTRDDIVELYGTDPGKIDIIYQGCDPQFAVPVDEAISNRVRAKYKLPERYIIAVGTVEHRKNQLQAVRALRHLPADVMLIIVGGHNKDYVRDVAREVAALGLTDRVRLLKGVPFADLPALYSMATVASYTSRYEGFGIPVIEAISAGVPVIAATGSCLEEAGGPGAVYVSPDSVDGYVDAARALLDTPAMRHDLVTRGREYIARFSPENFSQGLMGTYTKAISH